MAVELLLKNTDDVHPDPTIDRISSLKRGDLVYVQDSPNSGWDPYETLPEFSRLIVSDATICGVEPYMDHWYVEVYYDVLNHNTVDDIYDVRMYSNTPGLGELGVINYPELALPLHEWNVTISGTGTNEIIIQADMQKVLQSAGFWGSSTESIVFTWIDYNSGTHTFKVSYSGYHPYDTNRQDIYNDVISRIQTVGGTITQSSIYGQLIEIEIDSSLAIARFQEHIAQVAKKIVFARRYYIGTGAMNAIQTYMENNNGDPMTTDKNTLISYLNDRLEEI